LIELSQKTGARLVATNDVHYVRRDDAELQDILLCVQTGKLLSDRNRMRMNNDTYYLRSPEEMQNLFSQGQKHQQHPRNCENVT
jgi:DNA polymerase-3 subunit alpha